ncbi:MAG: ParB/RepB/Spo0J family partition protein [Gammaproteobacteria bacterium]
MLVNIQPELKMIAINRLVQGKYQPRRQFDETELKELSQAILSTNGLLQPLVVRQFDEQRYEIIAGERRWRAAQLAGLEEISCIISNYNDEKSLQASIIENINRRDLNPIEEAQAYQRLIDDFGYNHEEIACTVGKSRTKITNITRLLRLDSEVQERIKAGEISESQARLLIGLPENMQRKLANQCQRQGWNVRKLEAVVKQLKCSETNTPISERKVNPNVAELEQLLSNAMNCKATIEQNCQGGGYIKLNFANLGELQTLCNHLIKQEITA